MSLSLRQVPNLITAIRMVLVVPIVWSLVHHHLTTTLLLFGAAAASDGADGFLAKRFGWRTPLGAVLDPAADKLLLATVFVTLALLGSVPIWLMAAAVGRDVVIVLGALSYRYWFGPVPVRPTLISKINTGCQLVFILSVIARERFSLPFAWPVTLLGGLVFLTAVISGIDYVVTFGRRAVSQGSGPGPV